VRDYHVRCGAGVRRAARLSGSSHQYRNDPVHTVCHLPTCTSGREPENRRAQSKYVPRRVTTWLASVLKLTAK
jgi:hypothetical protein